MAIGQEGIAAMLFGGPGFLAFLFGVIAENKKPSGLSTPPQLTYDSKRDQSTCHYGNDPTIALGIVAVTSLFLSTVFALIALYYPYNGKRVPPAILWQQNGCLVTFTVLALVGAGVSEGLFVWDVSSELHHRINNVHSGRLAECPTAKTGLFGGAGFLALDTTLFFLTALLLTSSARASYLYPEDEEDDKGDSYYSEGPSLHASESSPDIGILTPEIFGTFDEMLTPSRIPTWTPQREERMRTPMRTSSYNGVV